MAQIRVLLVDDSPLFLGATKAVIARDPAIEVVGTATNGEEALLLVPRLRPDVIVCDVQMPKMSGIDFLKALLPRHPIPVVVISGTPGVTLKALQAGAVDFIPKPGTGETRDAFFRRVLSTIRIAASANVGAKMAANQATRPRKAGLVAGPGMLLRTPPKDVVVAIGASTGGTDAILAVVKNLPADFPGVLATQHMPAGFTGMYASRLDRECNLHVVEARDGMRVENGTMILAAGEHQLRLMKDARGYFVSSKRGMKVSGHIPSVDVLFESVAEVAGPKAIGVILTGMGGDGAEGLLQMRQAGAYTIGQDKETSVVYGMPMMAYNKGAVAKQLALGDIPAEIVQQLNRMR